MGEALTFRYDKIGDILYIDKCKPYAEQDSDELGDEIVARMNPKTGEIENIEILFFSKRLEANEEMKIPVSAHLKLSS